MQLPQPLLQSFENAPGFHKHEFIDVHESGEKVVSIRFNPSKKTIHDWPLISGKVPWSSYGHYLSERPFFTFDPLLHAGAYYVQEASSMFLEQALRQSIDLSQKIRVLDLCAAPGGKSTLIQSFINSESLLVSNEVIKSRVSILEENIAKWGSVNTIVTNNDPKDFRQLENFFDVMVVDAPCSGSGLFRRDPNAISEWSSDLVDLCAQRQQRILSDAYPSLKNNGVLIYSTCSYSVEEDEQILDWLGDHFRLESIQLKLKDEWNIVESKSSKHGYCGYRFYPEKLKGEGFFIACLRKKDGDRELPKFKIAKFELPTRPEREMVDHYIQTINELFSWKFGDRILAFPLALQTDLQMLMKTLYIKKAGIAIGKPAAKELIPDHEIALSNIINKNFVAISLKKEEALQYLRKEEVKINNGHRGWALIQYEGLNLGWVKVLPNRVNNYYPKEWRILKSANN